MNVVVKSKLAGLILAFSIIFFGLESSYSILLFLIVMLVTGYFGESGIAGWNPAGWGAISGAAYFWMAYEVGCLSIFGGPSGAVGNALASGSGKIPEAGRMLQWFVLVGWAIYPIGYMAGTDGWYTFVAIDEGAMNIIYNVGDAINKIGFGMAVWYAAKS